MNPFADSQFDPRLYEVVSKISKKSTKTRLRGLEELESALDSIDVEENIDTLVDAISEPMASPDPALKNISVDILHRLLSLVDDREPFRRILAIWLYQFLADPTHGTSRKMFDETDVQDFEDEFARLLDFEEEPILGLRCLLLLAMRGKRDYSKVFVDCIRHLRLRSVSELTEVYRLCKLLKGSEELLKKVEAVSGPTLMNMKWKILLDVFKATPECIVDDGKYLDPDILARVIENRASCDEIRVRTVDSLRAVFPKLMNAREYLVDFLKARPVENMCIFEFCTNLRHLDASVGPEIVNSLIANVLSRHLEDKEDISECVSRLAIDAQPSIEDAECRHNCSSVTLRDRENMFKTMVMSLGDLDGVERIKRARILGMVQNPTDFTKEEIEEVFPCSVDVFPKEYLLSTSFDCDELPLVLRYPDEIESSRLRRVVNRNNLHLFIPLCGDLDLLRSLVFVHDNNTLLSIYQSCNIPASLEMDFYHRLRDRVRRPETVDYGRLIRTYLDEQFISSLVENGVVDRDRLFDAALTYISNVAIPASTSYTSSFYDLDECFYRDVGVKERNLAVVELRKLYLRIQKSSREKFMVLLLDTMCGDEDDTLDILGRRKELMDAVSRDTERFRDIDLRRNQHFLEKLLDDLGTSSRPCGGKALEDLLKSGGMRAIDYIIRKSSVPAQFISFVDFSYLSNRALMNATGILKTAFENGGSMDFTGLSQPSMQSVDENAFFVKDEDFLRLLVRSDFGSLRAIDLSDVVRMIERDLLLQNRDFHRERYEIYSGLLEKIYRKVASGIFNTYSMSRLDMDSVDDEVYDLLRGSLMGARVLFWDILLNALLLIRNTSINSFFEKMVERREEWTQFLESAGTEERSLFAFIFPNMFCSLPRMEVSMDQLIVRESSKHVMGVVAKAQKVTNGFNIKITYSAGGMAFVATISIPQEYPYRRAVFSSEMGKKSLLNLKINEMLQRSSKFMELVSLWKVNIDERMSGHKECPICYFILDVHDSSFPTSQCATCKNRFHVRCLAKWTANGSRNSCPLCRRPVD